MKEAEALKAKNVKAITFFGSTAFDGEGVTRFIWTAVSSFGGKFSDGAGKMTLNTPENVKAVEFIREIVAKGYATDETFQGTSTPFIEEEPFKTAVGRLVPNRHLRLSLRQPAQGAMLARNTPPRPSRTCWMPLRQAKWPLARSWPMRARSLVVATVSAALSFPSGAKNIEAAHDYINWIMSAEQNAKWVQGPGGGFPALKATLATDAFNTPFYKQSAAAAQASACSPWYGTLDRRGEAKKVIMTAVYKLIKEDPTADIAATLKAAEEEYNKGG